jgi:hypothetical protein
MLKCYILNDSFVEFVVASNMIQLDARDVLSLDWEAFKSSVRAGLSVQGMVVFDREFKEKDTEFTQLDYHTAMAAILQAIAKYADEFIGA